MCNPGSPSQWAGHRQLLNSDLGLKLMWSDRVLQTDPSFQTSQPSLQWAWEQVVISRKSSPGCLSKCCNSSVKRISYSASLMASTSLLYSKILWQTFFQPGQQFNLSVTWKKKSLCFHWKKKSSFVPTSAVGTLYLQNIPLLVIIIQLRSSPATCNKAFQNFSKDFCYRHQMTSCHLLSASPGFGSLVIWSDLDKELKGWESLPLGT